MREQVLRPPGGADERIGAGTDGRVSEESQAMKAGKDGQVRTEDDRVWLGGHRMGGDEGGGRCEEEGGRKEEGGERQGGRFGTDTWRSRAILAGCEFVPPSAR